MNQPVVTYDTGRTVHLDSYSGGASQAGAWGQLTMRFTEEDGTEYRRRYIALDPEPGYGVDRGEMGAYDSNLSQHATRELAAWAKGSENDGLTRIIVNTCLNIVRVFASARHSGSTAGYGRALVDRLLQLLPLSPLTGEESEWDYEIIQQIDPDPDTTNPKRLVAQNRRCSRVFLRADGTAFDVEAILHRDVDGEVYTNRLSCADITFPYMVPGDGERPILPRPEQSDA